MRIKCTLPDHSGVVQLEAIQVEVTEVTQTAEAEGGHKVAWREESGERFQVWKVCQKLREGAI